ncbi:hypothetical protein J7E79_03735 [Bacillus sp. ISL-40]|uniref:hypothetical protein n=1 Tax=Bacillus sp. ISL-40 TaxID=2819126 RepID=UPI001BEB3743|nr:hypothetical protein [Bacillus sp. ISL-40]MBT2696537.1 hypothetical protein [Bacillus sp. ISL-40]
MKNNLNKVFNRFVTGLLTITVLGACGQNTKDTIVNNDNKKQVTKTEMGSRTNSVQIQTRNVSYAEGNATSGHRYGQIEQFERKAIEEVQNYAKELGFNVPFTRVEEGVIMDTNYKDPGNWRPSEMVKKIMEVYGIEKYPGGDEIPAGSGTFLIPINTIHQELQAKIKELGFVDCFAYKVYGINQINVYTYPAVEGDDYQVKKEKLFKYIEERVGRPITVDLFNDTAIYKYYSVKW